MRTLFFKQSVLLYQHYKPCSINSEQKDTEGPLAVPRLGGNAPYTVYEGETGAIFRAGYGDSVL